MLARQGDHPRPSSAFRAPKPVNGGSRAPRNTEPGYLLDAPVKYRTAADLFRLDLYKQFDVDTLAQLAAPAKVSQSYAEPSK
jgi:hypothetical protein